MVDLGDFIQVEESKMSWWDRALNNYPVIETTKTLALSAKKINPKTHVIIYPSISQKIMACVFLCPAFFIWFILLRLLFVEKTLIWVVIGSFLFASAIIYMVLYITFFNKKMLFTIFIGYNGIALGSTTYSWADIVETYIMTLRGNKTDLHTLVLHTKTDGFKTYSMYKFTIGMRKLSALIEHYKTNANLNAITPNII